MNALSAGNIMEASASPMAAANRHSSSDSASTSISTPPSEKPSVLSTASSGMRSRTDCIIVLPVRKSSVKKTAPRMERTMNWMSPCCLRKDCWNSFSVWVFVSSGEFSKSASMARATCGAWFGSFRRTTYQPTLPLPKLRASSK
jgi:hypothetical protein